MGNCCWFTNLDHNRRHEDIILYRTYNQESYPKYVNFNGIEVGRTSEIPMDYDGMMGVPVTFMDKYNPEQFEIVGYSLDMADMSIIKKELGRQDGGPCFYLRDEAGKLKRLYNRIVIQRKK